MTNNIVKERLVIMLSKKEINRQKRRMWQLIMSANNEVSYCVKTYGSAFVYDVTDGKKSQLVTVGLPSQINDNNLIKLGFNPQTTTVKFFMVVTSNHDIKYWNERR